MTQEELTEQLRDAYQHGDIDRMVRISRELNERYERQRQDHIDELTARGFWSQ